MKAQIHFYDSDGNDIFKKLADIKHCTGEKIPSLEIMLNRDDVEINDMMNLGYQDKTCSIIIDSKKLYEFLKKYYDRKNRTSNSSRT